MDLALKNKAPFIGLNDSGGARIQEGVLSLDGYGHIFTEMSFAQASFRKSLSFSALVRAARFIPRFDRLRFHERKTGQMFITGPKVIKTATGEAVSSGELGAPIYIIQSAEMPIFPGIPMRPSSMRCASSCPTSPESRRKASRQGEKGERS